MKGGGIVETCHPTLAQAGGRLELALIGSWRMVWATAPSILLRLGLRRTRTRSGLGRWRPAEARVWGWGSALHAGASRDQALAMVLGDKSTVESEVVDRQGTERDLSGVSRTQERQ